MPADYSIMTVAQIAQHYGTDVTGLVDVFQNLNGEVAYLEAIATIGAYALNAGAKREATGKTYTVYDMYDYLTEDMSLASQLIETLFSSVSGKSVFPTPPATAEKKKSMRNA